MFNLRDYQIKGVDYAYKLLYAQQRGCVAAPMGTGKSIVELATQSKFNDVWLISPRVEIIKGMLDKKGIQCDTEDEVVEAGWSHKITTPVRMRNALMKGWSGTLPTGLIIDEGHHVEAETYQQILLCCGKIGVVLFTATPFRGTPKGSMAFREAWGVPYWMLTYRQAVEQNYMKLPLMDTVPLVDDDVLEVGSNGEFQINSVEAATRVRLHSIVSLLRAYYANGKYDKPTIVSLPSTQLVHELKEACIRECLPVSIVTQATSYRDRQKAFSLTLACQTALIQINVVSEGVDLQLSRLIDCSPTLSPVKWTQQVGRITRPQDLAAEYLCTNRNLFRHAYTFEGIIPAAPLVQAQEAFPLPSKRAGSRVIGLEALGRLKPASVPLANGLELTTYAVTASEESKVVEYFAILHPRFPDPVWARRVDGRKADGTRDYGKWKACEPPADLQGFASLAQRELSEKQQAWWSREAKRFGLNHEHVPTRKTFAVLPVLKDIGLRFQT